MVDPAMPKTDLQQRELAGPVHTLKRAMAEWDETGQTWGPAKFLTEARFRTDEHIEQSTTHNPDGSTFHETFLYDGKGQLIEKQSWSNDGPRLRTRYLFDAGGRPTGAVEIAADGTQRETERYQYDSAGRKTKVNFLPSLPGAVMAVGVEGSEQSYGAPGATTSTTTYDENGLPNEVQVHDATHMLVLRIVFTRDRDGRVLTEESRFEGITPFGDFAAEKLKEASEEDRAKFDALIAAAFPDQTITRTSYEYDEKGRRVSVTRSMGAMGDTRTTSSYDAHDNVVEEVSESRQHVVSIDDDRNAVEKDEKAFSSRTRFEYQYDAKGNWTERIVSAANDPDGDFRRSNVEWREITYWR
jgi:hypothetical protein